LTDRNNLVGIDPVSRSAVAAPGADDGPAIRELLDTDGFALIRRLASDAQLDELRGAVVHVEQDVRRSRAVRVKRGRVFARRDLLNIAVVRDWVKSPAVRDVVRRVLGDGARAVRGILFDKTPAANWLVPWHQDLSIAVRERRDVEGFGPWSVKAGVQHVQPPVEILNGMLAVRIHLDPCQADNGPLRVIRGSHRALWTPAQLERLFSESHPVTCCADAGDALFMRPMLVHTSAPALALGHRRVVHIEFAPRALPSGLEWHCSIEL
jgi:hypothetical protein